MLHCIVGQYWNSQRKATHAQNIQALHTEPGVGTKPTTMKDRSPKNIFNVLNGGKTNIFFHSK